MNKQDINELTILDSDFVKVIETLNNVDVRFTENNEVVGSKKDLSVKQKSDEKVKRLDKDTYYDPISGKTKQYSHKEKRTENESTFFRTSRELNWIILNSFEGGGNEMMFTLTFKDNVENINEVNKLFRNFIRRLNRTFKGTLRYEYIVIREPHLSGKWHLHMLFKYDVIDLTQGLPIRIKEWHNLITDKWGNGIVDVRPIEQVNELATYMTKHLMDIKIDKNGEEVENFSEAMSIKTVAKNQRLNLYPQRMRIYSYSEGIKKPDKRYMTYGEMKRRFGTDYDKNYDNSFLLYNDSFALKQRQIQLTLKKKGD